MYKFPLLLIKVPEKLLNNLLNHYKTIAKRLHGDKIPNEAHASLRQTLENYLEINVKLLK